MRANSIIDHSVEWLKLVAQRNSFVYQNVMRWKARRVPSLLVRRNHTRIVIEAFPRSSNSFCVRLFLQANPGVARDEISHHAHVISNVKHAAKWGIPALVIVRDPIDAISSNMLAAGDVSDGMIRILAVKYVDFYGWVERNPNAVVLVDFSEITGGHFKAVSSRLNERFGTNFNTDFDEQVLAREVREAIEAASPNREDPSRIPIPSADREARYEELRPRIRSHPAIGAAIALHACLRERLAR